MVSIIKKTILNTLRSILRPIYYNWDAIVSFLFIALVFYLTYFALWVFCPCG